MKSIIVVFILSVVFSLSTLAQKPVVKETKIKVFGNCGMCKSRIEKSLKIKEVKYAKWDKKSKMLTLAYLSPSISLDSLEKRIAVAGHDTEKFKAADSVYNALPTCCLYRDKPETH